MIEYRTKDGFPILFFNGWEQTSGYVKTRTITFMDSSFKTKVVMSIRDYALSDSVKFTIYEVGNRKMFSEVFLKGTDPIAYLLACLGYKYAFYFSLPDRLSHCTSDN